MPPDGGLRPHPMDAGVSFWPEIADCRREPASRSPEFAGGCNRSRCEVGRVTL